MAGYDPFDEYRRQALAKQQMGALGQFLGQGLGTQAYMPPPNAAPGQQKTAKTDEQDNLILLLGDDDEA